MAPHPPPPPLPATELRQVDPTIWKACAGNSVQIPTVHSRVYYFPQGHVEQSSSPPILSPLVSSTPLVLCRILAVRFLANPETDEVFAKVRLEPVGRERPPALVRTTQSLEFSRAQDDDDDDDEEETKVASFAKILTPSDANNGGGFSVPRFCADLIFPPLNYQADPPVQTLSVTDIHGVVWDFRHIYRGTPRRHLLTTGWSKFVNHKKLIAGDSAVFMRNGSGELFIGIRRAARSNGDSGRWSCQGLQMVGVKEESGGREGFWRSGKGRVSAESVAEATELAVHGMPFEIVYYPRAGSPDFVVKAEMVEESLNVFWTAGMRVKMAMETEDSSRMTWFQGTVSSAAIPDNGPWRGSPWRMLQVTWDEPEVLQNVKRVSPWQVEYLVPTPPLQTPFPPLKRFRVPPSPGLLSDGEGELYPMTGLTDTMMRQFSPSLLNFNTFPAGMQGARHYPFHTSSLSNFISEDTHQTRTDDFFGNNVGPKFKNVTTELNIGSSQSDNLSPDSQSSVHSFGTDLIGNRGSNSSAKVGISSFQLFGKIIYMKEPVDSGFDDVGYMEDDGSKGYKETDGVNDPLDLTLTDSYTKLLNKLDVQCQSTSTGEAFSL
ncbi:hypothetical protein L1049_026529 [Liquidambar formosana]|uniref:Auxin response factor n=1 Tax=Liquidambar formosana TaxID=63359 RepID=A0AAP0NEY9_LIQFO